MRWARQHRPSLFRVESEARQRLGADQDNSAATHIRQENDGSDVAAGSWVPAGAVHLDDRLESVDPAPLHQAQLYTTALLHSGTY